MKKTFNTRGDNKFSRSYNLPPTKLRNVSCTHCKHQFFLREFVPLRGTIPLLLECGHVICERCANNSLHKPCPLCNMVTRLENSEKVSLPLHMYALGLMVVSHNRPVESDESDEISFSKSVNSMMKQKSSHGLCHECGIQATIKCPQCNALYCFVCYSKIHGRALQNHSKVVLSDNDDQNSFVVKNTCSERCTEALGYYCEQCDIAGCSHCILRLHKKHNYFPLSDKNIQLLPEFHKAHNRVMESLKRIRHAQKKLESTVQYPTKMQNADTVETAITQHFAYLHGVLQNVERKIIDTLHRQQDSRNNNIDEISAQLKELENQLHSALVVTSSVEDNLDKIDLQQVIQKLQKLAEFPCHLVINSVPDDQEIRFTVDESIVDYMEKHCSIQVPTVSSFTLQRTELLPDDYEIEPLTEEINIPQFRARSVVRKKSKSIESLGSQKNDRSLPAVGCSEMVRVTHVIDPSAFYVQLVQNQNRIAELMKGLAILANTSGVIPTEVTLNALYVVQSAKDRAWYRGRVVEKKTEANGDEKYSILFIDHGLTETNVPLSRIRNITPQFSVIPTLSLRCALHDVVPNHGRWHPDATKTFKQLVSKNSMVSMYIMMITGDTYYVELCVISSQDSGLISVKDSLTYMKYATCVSPNKLMKMNPDSTRQYYREQLELECFTDVQILFVENPSCIYVQKTHANRAYYCTLVHEMTDHYERNTHSSELIPVPHKDLPCAARGVDGLWHRGLVSEITENTVKVFYVDLGYSLILNYDAIRSLPRKYMTCKTQAIRLSLRGIKPPFENKEHWPEETNEFLKTFLINGRNYKVIAYDKLGDTYTVAMYTPDKKTSITFLLTKKGLAQSAGSNNYCGETSNKRQRKYKPKKDILKIEPAPPVQPAYSIENTVTKPKSLLEDVTEDPFKVRVTIHHAQSPDCIYVSDATCGQDDVDSMMRRMQEFYSKYRSAKRQTWSNNTVCAVFSHKTDMFYRGRIIDIKSADKVVVFLYDVGLEETVTINDIQSLYPPFFKVSTYVFKIKLTGILPCGGSTSWPSLSCEELRKIIDDNHNCKFYISKLEEEDIEDSAISVELWIKQVKMDGPLAPTRVEINSVNRMLVEKGVALPVKEYARKRDKILAVELKRQFIKKLERLSNCELNVKWLKIEEDLDNTIDSTDNETSRTLLRYSNSSSDEDEDFDKENMFDNIPSLPKLTSWLPPDTIAEDSFIGIPTYLDHDGYLYLHSKTQNTATLRKIEYKLEKLYNQCTIESCDTAWAAGDLCIAQYHANSKWYRGKIDAVLTNDIVNVEFIDYGNIEECAVGTVKKKVVLENIPVQCTKCLIYGLRPVSESGKWRTEDLDKIHTLLIEQECQVTVLDRTKDHLVVSITLLPNKHCNKKINLISFLVTEWGINVKCDTEDGSTETSMSRPDSPETPDVILEDSEPFCEPLDNEVEVVKDIVMNESSVILQEAIADESKDDSSSVINDVENLFWRKERYEVATSTPNGASNDSLVSYYFVMNIPDDVDFIEIEACCSISPLAFHAQLKENLHSPVLNSYYRQYELLMNELQESATKQPKIANIVRNTPCCARYRDGLWYRCLISHATPMDGTDHIEVKLLFVDYGNDEYRSVNPKQCELYSMKKEWLELPTMSIKCKLWNLEMTSNVNNETLINELEKMYSRRIFATVKEVDDEDFVSIEVYEDETRTELMYSTLIEQGLFKYKSAKN